MKFLPSVFKNRIAEGLTPLSVVGMAGIPLSSSGADGEPAPENAPAAPKPAEAAGREDDSGQPLKLRIRNAVSGLVSRLDRAASAISATPGAPPTPRTPHVAAGHDGDTTPAAQENPVWVAQTRDEVATLAQTTGELASKAAEWHRSLSGDLDRNRRELREFAERWQQLFDTVQEGIRSQEPQLRTMAVSQDVLAAQMRALLHEIRGMAAGSARSSQGIHIDLTHQRLKTAELVDAVLQRLEAFDLAVNDRLQAIQARLEWHERSLMDLTHGGVENQEMLRSLAKDLAAAGSAAAERQERIVQEAAALLSQKLDAYAVDSEIRQDGIKTQIDAYAADDRLRAEEIQKQLQHQQRVLDGGPAAAERLRDRDLVNAILQKLNAAEEARLERQERVVQEAAALLSQKLDAYAVDANTRQDGIKKQIDAYGLDDRLRAEEIQRELQRQQSVLDRGLTEVRQRVKAPVFRAGHDLLVTQVDDFVIAMPEDEWRMAAYLAFWGSLEQGFTRYFGRTIQPGAVVVDVGANIGLHTLHAARLVSKTGKVYSFEPTPRTFEVLKGNLQVNGFLDTGTVETRRVAISDRNGTATFYAYPNECGLNTLFRREGECEILTVETVQLDDAIPPGSRVDFVKVDAEGAEPFVLGGMSRIIAENPGILIAMEFAPVHLLRAGVEPSRFIDDIARMGFGIVRIDDFTGDLLPLEQGELERVHSANILLSRPATSA